MIVSRDGQYMCLDLKHNSVNTLYTLWTWLYLLLQKLKEEKKDEIIKK
jgi:hypothetical protein